MAEQLETVEVNEESSCQICLVGEDQRWIDFPCHTNKLCYDCCLNYVKATIQDVSYQKGQAIKCPVCQELQTQNNTQAQTQKKQSPSVSAETVLQLFQPEHRQQINDSMLETYLRNTTDVERCPLSRCKFAYIPQQCSLFTRRAELQCPMCYTNLSTGFSLSLTPLITFLYITFMTNNCPKCDIPIDRISGCYHMTCSCRHEFCWYCLKDYHSHTQGSMYEQHNQKDCILLLFTKILILLTSIWSAIILVLGIQTFDYMTGLLKTVIFGILRTVATDGVILLEVFIVSRRPLRLRKMQILVFLACNIVTALIMYYLGELGYTLAIIGISILVALTGVGVSMLVEFSVSSWFNYIM